MLSELATFSTCETAITWPDTIKCSDKVSGRCPSRTYSIDITGVSLAETPGHVTATAHVNACGVDFERDYDFNLCAGAGTRL